MNHTYIPDKCPTVAVVDDHQLLRDEVCRILELKGFHVSITAANGKELLDSLVNLSNIPDLCLLDINMPVMNGFDTAPKLKELYPQIKILAFSFIASKEITTEILKCGAHDYLFKGSHPDNLKAALMRLYNLGCGS